LTRHLGSAILDPPSWISLFFKKSQQIKEIKTQSSKNAYEMYKFMNVCYFMRQTGKKMQHYVKKLIFGQTCMEFDGCYSNAKNDRLTIHTSKLVQRMKEQLLKV